MKRDMEQNAEDRGSLFQFVGNVKDGFSAPTLGGEF